MTRAHIYLKMPKQGWQIGVIQDVALEEGIRLPYIVHCLDSEKRECGFEGGKLHGRIGSRAFALVLSNFRRNEDRQEKDRLGKEGSGDTVFFLRTTGLRLGGPTGSLLNRRDELHSGGGRLLMV